MDAKYDYIIHTDGAFSKVNDEGAFAFILCDGNNVELQRKGWKQKKNTGGTNNRMELKAIMAAIYHLPPDAKRILIESDSQYALNTLSGKYKRHKNLDLFAYFDKMMEEKDIDITWKWVKGHSGDMYNEFCDGMCQMILGYDPSNEYKRFKKE